MRRNIHFFIGLLMVTILTDTHVCIFCFYNNNKCNRHTYPNERNINMLTILWQVSMRASVVPHRRNISFCTSSFLLVILCPSKLKNTIETLFLEKNVYLNIQERFSKYVFLALINRDFQIFGRNVFWYYCKNKK